jgi:hypothetical protein
LHTLAVHVVLLPFGGSVLLPRGVSDTGEVLPVRSTMTMWARKQSRSLDAH